MNIKIKIGDNKTGQNLFYNFESNKHLIISGCPRPGIVDMLHLIVDQLSANNTPEEIKLVIVDVHRIEFGEYENSQHLLYPIVRDLDTLPDVFDNFLNSLNPSPQKHFFIIEELCEVVLLYPKETEEFVTQVAKSSNAYLVIGIQRPSETVLSDKILQAIPDRITFHQNNIVESERLVGCSNAVDLNCNGDFIHKSTKGLTYGKLDIENKSLDYILNKVFASERVGLAHFYSKGDRDQTYAIDNSLISPNDDYNLASNCYYSLTDIHNKLNGLSELNTPIIFKICEDIALASYLVTTMSKALTEKDLLPLIVKRNLDLLQIENTDEITSICFSPEFSAIVDEFYGIGKSTATYSYHV